ESLDLPSLEMPELSGDRPDFSDLWPAEGFDVPEMPFSEELEPGDEPKEKTELPSPATSRQEPELQEAESQEPEHKDEDTQGIKRVDSLPQVITADMLRARKGKSLDL